MSRYDDFGRATSAELLRRSDLAMYSAKDRGRARIECYSGSRVAEPGRLERADDRLLCPRPIRTTSSTR